MGYYTASEELDSLLTPASDAMNKASRLEEEKQKKLDRLSGNQNQFGNLENTYTELPTGTIEQNQNKIWNTYNPAELLYQTQYAKERYANDTLKGNISRRFYEYGLQPDEYGVGGTKYGTSTGRFPTSDPRYNYELAKQLDPNTDPSDAEWRVTGPNGPDLSQKRQDSSLDWGAGTVLEGLYHGNDTLQQLRKTPDYLSPEAQQSGSGISEKYTTSLQNIYDEGMYDDLTDERKAELRQEFDEYVTKLPGAQSNYGIHSKNKSSSSYGSNLVDAAQYSIGSFVAKFGDAVADAIITEDTGKWLNKKLGDDWVSKKGDFTALDRYKLAKEYGYDDSRIQNYTKEFTKVWSDPKANWVDKALVTLKGVQHAPEVLASSSGDIVAAMTGLPGLAAMAIGQGNEMLAEREKIKGTLTTEDYFVVAPMAIAYAAINKFTNGMAGLVPVKNVVRESLKYMDKGAAAKLFSESTKLVKESGKSGLEEGLEEIFQGYTEEVGTKLFTDKQDEILSKETLIARGSEGALGFGAGAGTTATKNIPGIVTEAVFGGRNKEFSPEYAKNPEYQNQVFSSIKTVDDAEVALEALGTRKGAAQDQIDFMDELSTSINNLDTNKDINGQVTDFLSLVKEDKLLFGILNENPITRKQLEELNNNANVSSKQFNTIKTNMLQLLAGERGHANNQLETLSVLETGLQNRIDNGQYNKEFGSNSFSEVLQNEQSSVNNEVIEGTREDNLFHKKDITKQEAIDNTTNLVNKIQTDIDQILAADSTADVIPHIAELEEGKRYLELLKTNAYDEDFTDITVNVPSNFSQEFKDAAEAIDSASTAIEGTIDVLEYYKNEEVTDENRDILDGLKLNILNNSNIDSETANQISSTKTFAELSGLVNNMTTDQLYNTQVTEEAPGFAEKTDNTTKQKFVRALSLGILKFGRQKTHKQAVNALKKRLSTLSDQILEKLSKDSASIAQLAKVFEGTDGFIPISIADINKTISDEKRIRENSRKIVKVTPRISSNSDKIYKEVSDLFKILDDIRDNGANPSFAVTIEGKTYNKVSEALVAAEKALEKLVFTMPKTVLEALAGKSKVEHLTGTQEAIVEKIASRIRGVSESEEKTFLKNLLSKVVSDAYNTRFNKNRKKENILGAINKAYVESEAELISLLNDLKELKQSGDIQESRAIIIEKKLKALKFRSNKIIKESKKASKVVNRQTLDEALENTTIDEENVEIIKHAYNANIISDEDVEIIINTSRFNRTTWNEQIKPLLIEQLGNEVYEILENKMSTWTEDEKEAFWKEIVEQQKIC